MIATATQGQTLAQFAESMMPGWRFPDDWLAWPPDTFALTSAVLSRTGAYRQVIEAEWSRNALWQREAESAAQAWITQISRSLSPPRTPEPPGEHPGKESLDAIVNAVRAHADSVTLEQLRTLEVSQAVEFAEALLKLHAIADEACTGFGVMGPMRSDSALAHCLANLLLTAKGSLSQLPKHAGVVLPKLRTPQQGLTLRSLSHHVTYHLTEVEVMWRAMPWPNVDENTVNILAIPWPPTVHTQHFEPRGDTFQTVRYFSYWPTHTHHQNRLPVDRVTALVEKIQQEHCRIHLIVFPESALTATEYRDLLAALKQARLDDRLTRVPMVLAGLHRHEDTVDYNEVHLAAYYAERWYELSQRKHHRWRLDRNQIRQYGLEGRLATARSWYENIALGQRRLTFLVPNGWLALCPLICEDLAQLEPVSEVIRGVGPTLLFSLLADGPQLPQRWSARYASVFADDPGTAVLTLSSLGMVQKSQRLDGVADAEPARTVALWKDQVMGWKTIDLPRDGDAVLLTVSAELREEYTADGRGDHQSAAAFRFEGVRGFDLPVLDGAGGGGPAREGGDALATAADQEDDDKLMADWGDIRELSAATFAINALLHLRRSDDVALVLDWLLADEHAERKPLGDERLRGLVRQVMESQRDPKSAGISPGPQEPWPTESLRRAADAIGAFFQGCPDADPEFWTRLVDEARARLTRYARRSDGERDPHRRVERIIPYSVLTCTYGFLERLRRRRTPKHGEVLRKVSPGGPAPLGTADAAKLFKDVEDALQEFSY